MTLKNSSTPEELPMPSLDHRLPGFRLLTTITGHTQEVMDLVWLRKASGNKELLISCSADKTIRIWESDTGLQITSFVAHDWTPDALRVTADDKFLISASWQRDAKMWGLGDISFSVSPALLQTFTGHAGTIWGIAILERSSLFVTASSDHSLRMWPSGEILYQGSSTIYSVDAFVRDDEEFLLFGDGNELKILNVETRNAVTVHRLHSAAIRSVSIARGRFLLSGSEDNTITVWDLSAGAMVKRLSGHSSMVVSMCSSHDGSLLVSRSVDRRMLFWDTDNWGLVSALNDEGPGTKSPVAFSHNSWRLATIADGGKSIHIWAIDHEVLFSRGLRLRHRIAKVLFLGESGVGKTSLVNSLAKLGCFPTESTHGRETRRITVRRKRVDQSIELFELLLCDLAGQPGFNIVHQVNLLAADFAVVLFDPRTESNLFEGARYWTNVLKVLDSSRSPGTRLPRILIQSRSDLSLVRIPQNDVYTFLENGFYSVFIRASRNSPEPAKRLLGEIDTRIDWAEAEVVDSSHSLHCLIAALQADVFDPRFLVKMDDVCHKVNQLAESFDVGPFTLEEVKGAVQSAEKLEYIRYFHQLDLVLLQPELLDSISAALIDFVSDSGGQVDLEELYENRRKLRLPERWQNLEDSVLVTLMDLVIGSLIESDTAFYPWKGCLSIPSRCNVITNEAFPGEQQAIFRFTGPVKLSFASLAVSVNRRFNPTNMLVYSNQVRFRVDGSDLAIELSCYRDDEGEILFYSERLIDVFQFVAYAQEYLRSVSVSGSVDIYRLHRCATCTWFPGANTRRAIRDARIPRFSCPRCGGQLSVHSFYAEVFISCNHRDIRVGLALHDRLEERGVTTYMYRKSVEAGAEWKVIQAEAIKNAALFIVVVGKDGVMLGTEQHNEIHEIIDQRKAGKLTVVIPLILPGSNKKGIDGFADCSWIDYGDLGGELSADEARDVADQVWKTVRHTE